MFPGAWPQARLSRAAQTGPGRRGGGGAGLRKVDARRAIEQVAARTRESDCNCSSDDREVELEAALADPESLGEVDRGDGHEHGAYDREAPKRRKQTEGEQEASTELRKGGDPGPRLRRPDAEPLHRLNPAGHSGSAPPAE